MSDEQQPKPVVTFRKRSQSNKANLIKKSEEGDDGLDEETTISRRGEKEKKKGQEEENAVSIRSELVYESTREIVPQTYAGDANNSEKMQTEIAKYNIFNSHH